MIIDTRTIAIILLIVSAFEATVALELLWCPCNTDRRLGIAANTLNSDGPQPLHVGRAAPFYIHVYYEQY